jgi:hypothetical protein
MQLAAAWLFSRWLGQAGAEGPRGADEFASAATGVQNAQQKSVQAVEEERRGLLRVVAGDLAAWAG